MLDTTRENFLHLDSTMLLSAAHLQRDNYHFLCSWSCLFNLTQWAKADIDQKSPALIYSWPAFIIAMVQARPGIHLKYLPKKHYRKNLACLETNTFL